MHKKPQSLTQFLSTPSARRATRLRRQLRRKAADFYPRPPRGGRLTDAPFPRTSKRFLSTPSARRATAHQRPCTVWRSNFYPRPPRGGRPLPARHRDDFTDYFYPRPPRGGRPARSARRSTAASISIHALREEGDRGVFNGGHSAANFYPRPPRGGRLPGLIYRCSMK